MKKIASILASIVMLGGVMSLASCNNKPLVRIQLTASKPGTDLSGTASKIGDLLSKEMPDYRFSVKTGTDFAADGNALAAGTIDASFMTASSYAQTERKHSGKIEMILSATRSGFKVISDHNFTQADLSDQSKLDQVVTDMNNGNYHGEAAGTATYYCAELIMRKSDVDAFDTNNNGKIELEELAGKRIGMQGVASPAGFSYPSYAFSKATNGGKWANGMKMVAATATPDADKGEFIGIQGKGYGDMFNDLLLGDKAGDTKIDAMWGYMDVRNDAFNGSTGWTGKSEYSKGQAKIWDDTYTVALTSPIKNDGFAVRSNLDSKIKEGLAAAFKKFTTEGDKNDPSTPAGVIFSLYSHTGYEDATNEDYANEVKFDEYCENNKIGAYAPKN